ncbi:FixH family protein [Amycolatopsis anabasis]|uniref:FixH family protein n=1 Tax=Amycolatopsis anabasis TaxID=1840409 RepID=UPI00131A9FD2|nr:FixH family protein [Amycolatopsis anabasis]
MTTEAVRRKPVALIAGVVVAAGVLLAWLLWPAGDSGPNVLRGGTERYAVELSLDNPRVGANSVALLVTDPRGAPVALDSVTVEPVMPQMGHAITPVPAGPDGPGRYRAHDLVLPMSGQWELTVRLRGAPGPDQVVFPLLVNG